MKSSSSQDGSSDGERRKPIKPRKKSEQPNKDIAKGGLDGLQEGSFIHITDLSYVPHFQSYIQSFPVVAYFTGTWCGPAQEMNDLMIDLSDHYVTLTFIKIDLSLENKEIFEFMMHLNIRELPTFLFYYEGKQVFKLVGAFSDELVHLTHCLYMRQVLSHIRFLRKKLNEAANNEAEEFLVKIVKDELSNVMNGVGEVVQIYDEINLLT